MPPFHPAAQADRLSSRDEGIVSLPLPSPHRCDEVRGPGGEGIQTRYSESARFSWGQHAHPLHSAQGPLARHRGFTLWGANSTGYSRSRCPSVRLQTFRGSEPDTPSVRVACQAKPDGCLSVSAPRVPPRLSRSWPPTASNWPMRDFAGRKPRKSRAGSGGSRCTEPTTPLSSFRSDTDGRAVTSAGEGGPSTRQSEALCFEARA